MKNKEISVQIAYKQLHQESIRKLLRDILKIAQKEGMPISNSLYITFYTKTEGVVLTNECYKFLKDDSIFTIVLNTDRFWDLSVSDEKFSVELEFDGKVGLITVPFSSILGFNDPIAGFGIALVMQQSIADISAIIEQPKARGEEDGGITNRSNLLPFKHPLGLGKQTLNDDDDPPPPQRACA